MGLHGAEQAGRQEQARQTLAEHRRQDGAGLWEAGAQTHAIRYVHVNISACAWAQAGAPCRPRAAL